MVNLAKSVMYTRLYLVRIIRSSLSRRNVTLLNFFMYRIPKILKKYFSQSTQNIFLKYFTETDCNPFEYFTI